jgi:XTP/dITP diphosphohydrolase
MTAGGASALPARLVLATGNAGKVREFAELLAPLAIEVLPQSRFGIEPPPETGTTFAANALIKARNAAQRSGLPAMADDSGIEVDALDGAPGVYSARFAGEHASDADNLNAMLERLSSVPAERRGAAYRCVIVLARAADDPAPLVVSGAWRGRLLDTPRGAGGFGYDPIFVPEGETRTVAELPAAKKNAASHRGQALRALLAALAASRT